MKTCFLVLCAILVAGVELTQAFRPTDPTKPFRRLKHEAQLEDVKASSPRSLTDEVKASSPRPLAEGSSPRPLDRASSPRPECIISNGCLVAAKQESLSEDQDAKDVEPACGMNKLTGEFRGFRYACEIEYQNCRDGNVWIQVPIENCFPREKDSQ